MKPISDYTAGRDNNFNLLRLVAATMVLVSHSYALSTGRPELEPLNDLLGVKLGSLAVDIFFAASGFLVAGSLVQRQNLLEFFGARALRIYPGLWMALAISISAVAIWFTPLSLGEFFLQKETWRYILKNGFLLADVAYTLPGAFEGAPLQGFAANAVNGSIWTLPLEIKMYGLLGLLWLVLRILKRPNIKAMGVVCLGVALLSYAADVTLFVAGDPSHPLSLLSKFFMGASLRLWQHRVPTSPALGWGLCLAVLVSAIDPMLFGLVYRTAMAYVVIYLALVPAGPLRVVNRMGDYSYGIYIYAFPVQQAIVILWKGVGPIELTFAAWSITFIFAVASWHLIEERCLKLKHLFKIRSASA